MNEQIAMSVAALIRSAVDNVNTSINNVMLVQSNELSQTQTAEAQQILGDVQVWLSEFTQRIEQRQ